MIYEQAAGEVEVYCGYLLQQQFVNINIEFTGFCSFVSIDFISFDFGYLILVVW